MEPCASSDYSDHSDPFPESFGFPLPSPVWVGRFFIKSIVWFFSPISRLGWEVFHQINQVRFFIEPTRSGPSPSLPASLYQSLVFLLSYSTGLGGFSPITLHGSFSFSPQFSYWVRRFFINQSLLYRPHCPPGARSMIFKNLVFSPNFSIYKQEVFSTVSRVGYTTSIATRSSQLVPKKEGNCNAVATKIT